MKTEQIDKYWEAIKYTALYFGVTMLLCAGLWVMGKAGMIL